MGETTPARTPPAFLKERRLRPRWVAAVLALALLVGLSAAASAQDGRRTVRLDGNPVFRVSASDTTGAASRAQQIERRLLRLLEHPTRLAPARVEPAADLDARLVTVAGIPVVTVTPADAEENLTTVETLARQWANAIDTALARAQARRTTPWSRFLVEVEGAVSSAFGRLVESAVTVIPRALAALLVILLFWGLAAGTRRVMRFVFRRIVSDLTVENLIKQVAYYTVWALGLVVAVGALGFEPATVVTGLGLTGLALGFALKDIISNFVSGLLILTLRPFELGDQIVVGDTEGAVERIVLRATQIRTYDGRRVLVPNAEVFTSKVTNNTASPVRRGQVHVYVGYGTDLRAVADVLLRAATAADGVIADPPVSVRVEELGPDDIVIAIRYWTDSRRSDFQATASAVRRAAVEALGEAGFSLPDPAVRVLIPKEPDHRL